MILPLIGIYFGIGAIAAGGLWFLFSKEPDARPYRGVVSLAAFVAWPVCLVWLVYAIAGTVWEMIRQGDD